MATHILVVDDETAIADLVEVYLKNEGFTIHKFYNASDALACVRTTRLDLAVLDVMLPDMDGFTLCQRIREDHLFPIIMLTAKVEDMDKIMGLTLGADDYITKPFNPLELVARVKTQLRRYTRYNPREGTVQEVTEYDFRGLQISKATHKCVLFGEELALTPLEFSILWYLCEHRGNVVSSEELFEHVWGEAFMDSNNTVMSHIARLREKMHEPSRKPKFIKTVKTRFLDIVDELFAETGKRIDRQSNELQFIQYDEKLPPYLLSSGEKQILLILLTVLTEDQQH